MKIAHLVLASFLFILLLFSITTYINFKQSEAVKENAEYLSRSAEIIRNTARFQRNILNMVSGLRGYLLTGEKYFIESYDTTTLENESILRELSALIPDTSVQKIRLRAIEALNNKWVDEFAEPLRDAKTLAIVHDSNLNDFKVMYREKLITGDEKHLHNKLQEKFRAFSNYEYETRDFRRAVLSKSVQTTKRISFLLTAVSILLSVATVGFLTYRISLRINQMVQLANEISSGNYTVQIKDNSKDELSKLSVSLNNMAHALSENITELKRKNEELDQFAHIVSHDLKGPLRGIDNVVTWIEEDHTEEISPQINDYLQLIKGRITRAENLIEGILSYARIDKEEVQKERVSVNLLIKEVLENVATDTALNFSVQKVMPQLYTEKLPLFQVFSNLISNAIKYHDKPDGKIKIYFKEHPAHYEFFIEDDGPGIGKNYHDRIFVIFQTLNDRDSFESTGVGLAIVKKILDARKETIKIISELGKGSIFSFTWSKTN